MSLMTSKELLLLEMRTALADLINRNSGCLISSLLLAILVNAQEDQQTEQFILQNKYKLGEQPTNNYWTYNEMLLSISDWSIFATMVSTS